MQLVDRSYRSVSPGRGNYVLFLGKTLDSLSTQEYWENIVGPSCLNYLIFWDKMLMIKGMILERKYFKIVLWHDLQNSQKVYFLWLSVWFDAWLRVCRPSFGHCVTFEKEGHPPKSEGACMPTKIINSKPTAYRWYSLFLGIAC